MLPQAKPRPLQYFFHVADHKWFSVFMIAVTCFNTLILAMDYYQAPPDYVQFLDVANLTCTIIFTVELVLKILGLGPRSTDCHSLPCTRVVRSLSLARVVIRLLL